MIALKHIEPLPWYEAYTDAFRKKLAEWLNKGCIGSNKVLDAETKLFFGKLIYCWFDDLLYGKPSNLRWLIKLIEKQHPAIKDQQTILHKRVKHAFVKLGYDYKHSFQSHKADFVKMLGLTCCPYCNRTYIHATDVKDGKKTVKAELDHFFNKSRYPYLALSFYNLIPSCPFCNGEAGKHDKDAIAERLVSPYEINTDDLRFTFDVTDIRAYYANHPNAVAVRLEASDEFENNVRVFNLRELYAHHADHVSELVHKSRIQYPATYRDFMQAACAGLSISKQKVDRLIVGNYTDKESLHRRPLAKMYRDIALELELIDTDE